MTTTTQVHVVLDSQNNEIGQATEELAKASHAASHEGWILASVGTDGLWHQDSDGQRIYVRSERVVDVTTESSCPAAIICECGEITGHACGKALDVSEGVVVEHMPEYLRASHDSAGNRGAYPHNGSVRLLIHPSHVDDVVDGDWTTQI